MSARITLTVTTGELKGKEYVFDEQAWCVIGRAEDCDIQLPRDLDHAQVSRHHCLLEIEPPTIRVRDLGSRNGTYVNGTKIGQRAAHQSAAEADLSRSLAHELNDGDDVQVGDIVFRIGIGVAPDPGKAVHYPLFHVR